MIALGAAMTLMTGQPDRIAPPPLIPAVQSEEARNEAALREVARRLDRLEVRITAGPRLLWAGTVEVNRMAPARYSETRLNAVAPDCPELRSGLQVGDELSFEAYKYGGNLTDPDHYRFTVSWQRRYLADDCRNTGTQLVRLEEHRHLAAGEAFELRGDGDLVVRIRRR